MRNLIPSAICSAFFGIGSLIFLAIAVFIGAIFSPDSPYLWVALCLFSFPHFAATYRIFYSERGYRTDYWFYGWGYPCLLFFILSYAVVCPDSGPIEWVARLAYVGLLWHYLRQTYGVSIRISRLGSQKPFSFSKRLLTMTTFLLGVSTLLHSQQGAKTQILFGVFVPALPVSKTFCDIQMTLAWSSLVAFLFWVVLDYLKSRDKHRLLSAVPVLALYGWFFPFFSSSYALLLPVFHGAQFLPFYFERSHSTPDPTKKRIWAFMIGWFFLVIAGVLLFQGLPSLLSQFFPYFGPRRMVAAVSLFLSLHHYGLDSVIWKSKRQVSVTHTLASLRNSHPSFTRSAPVELHVI